MLLKELDVFNFFRYGMILYLTIADGMNNPWRIKELYAHNPLIRYAYTLFGAYNVFGSDVGMDLGFKTSVVVSGIMMILLDIIPIYLRDPKYNEDEEFPFVPFFSANTQSYIVAFLLVFLYMHNFN